MTSTPRTAGPPPTIGIFRTLVAVFVGFFIFASVLVLVAALAVLTVDANTLLEPGTWRMGIGFQLALLAAGGVGALAGGTVARPIGGSRQIVPIFAIALCVTVLVWLFLRMQTVGPLEARGPEDSNASIGGRLVIGSLLAYSLPAVAALAAYVGGRAADRIQRGLLGDGG